MKKIPAFSLPGSDGRTWTQADLAARTTVLYFYPRDNTPGCTRESCGFRDAMAGLARQGVQVVGVSPDSLASHARFIADHQLNFPLLADEDHVLARKLGAWGEKTSYGKTTTGLIRSTFLIAQGAIVRTWSPVKVDSHVEEVVAAVQALAAPGGKG